MPANASLAIGPLSIGLVAHDDKKAALVDWAVAHQAFLSRHTPPAPRGGGSWTPCRIHR
jgi:methylglyoxal synthase